MIMDERIEFCDATALNTGGAASYLLGDVIDLQVARDIGHGQPIYLVITVDTAFASGGAGTVQFTLASDAQAAIAVDGTATVHAQTGVFAVADGVAGATLAVLGVPAQGAAYERYLGILQTTATAAMTGGKINAFLTIAQPGWKAYADATD